MLTQNTPYRYIPYVSPVARSLRRMVHTVAFQGETVSCPTCAHEWRAFVGDARVGSCPGCESQSRHRMLWLALERKHPDLLERPRRILHFAAEPCLQRRFRHLTRHTYTTVDIAERGMDVQSDITALVFPDRSFDVILCNHVLEHIPDDAKAMSELHRVLAPGGCVFIMVPYEREKPTDEDASVTDPVARTARWGQHDHVRTYGVDLPDRLRQAGFEVTLENVYRDVAPSERARFGLWDDLVFFCRKPGHDASETSDDDGRVRRRPAAHR